MSTKILIAGEDLAWAAGLLEGEGWFGWLRGYPVISLEMTDEDIVQRFANLLPKSTGSAVYHRIHPEKKDSYRYYVQGKHAIETMELLLPFMGERRSSKICEIIELCRTKAYYDRPGYSA